MAVIFLYSTTSVRIHQQYFTTTQCLTRSEEDILLTVLSNLSRYVKCLILARSLKKSPDMSELMLVSTLFVLATVSGIEKSVINL
jgi:hypothetical protein